MQVELEDPHYFCQRGRLFLHVARGGGGRFFYHCPFCWVILFIFVIAVLTLSMPAVCSALAAAILDIMLFTCAIEATSSVIATAARCTNLPLVSTCAMESLISSLIPSQLLPSAVLVYELLATLGFCKIGSEENGRLDTWTLGHLDDSVESAQADKTCFEYRTYTGHEDYKFHKQKRQPVMVGVA